MEIPQRLWTACSINSDYGHSGENVFLCYVSCISVCAYCLSSVHWLLLRRVCLHFLYAPHQVFIMMGKISLNLLFCCLNSPALSASPCILESWSHRAKSNRLETVCCSGFMQWLSHSYTEHETSEIEFVLTLLPCWDWLF